ncbi:hypothetical protein [Rhodococcus rhodochrous]|uniref:hypothetical protein n=1 Tax=Rhodococcus rhodochrous TaxID=1829 RepID=UPI00119FB76B|nr:hypothetical protein [Rhodococcus rhodochrous]
MIESCDDQVANGSDVAAALAGGHVDADDVVECGDAVDEFGGGSLYDDRLGCVGVGVVSPAQVVSVEGVALAARVSARRSGPETAESPLLAAVDLVVLRPNGTGERIDLETRTVGIVEWVSPAKRSVRSVVSLYGHAFSPALVLIRIFDT